MAHASPLILWPTIALALLIFAVWFVLLRRRFAHIAANPPTAKTFADGESTAHYFRPVERPARNLSNLFEMPVLYFALVPLLMLTGEVSAGQIALAWIFVVLRALHSVVHIGPNAVRLRARLYIASCAVLAAMWLGFAVTLLIPAGASA